MKPCMLWYGVTSRIAFSALIALSIVLRILYGSSEALTNSDLAKKPMYGDTT